MKKIFSLFFVLVLLFACTGKLHEVVESAYEDGTPKVVKLYKIQNGDSLLVKEISYYENHKIRMEGTFKNNQRDGKWLYYYENGNKWSVGFFKDGRRDGFGKTWHRNGTKYIEGKYENGTRAGKWKFWDEKGELIKEIDYEKNEAEN